MIPQLLIFVSRWDKAVTDKLPSELQNKLGLAVMTKTFHSYLKFLKSDRVRKIMNFGASPQRLLWASTGTKDPNASDILYVKSLVAADSMQIYLIQAADRILPMMSKKASDHS